MSAAPTEYLFWLTQNTKTDDPKYGKTNAALIDEWNRIIDSRNFTQKAPKQDLPTIQLQKPGKDALIRDIKALIDDLYKHAAEMQRHLDVYQADGSVTTSKSDLLPF